LICHECIDLTQKIALSFPISTFLTTRMTVHVSINVVPGMEDAFVEATLQNARSSALEEGVVRFDVYRDQEDRHQFVLVEVYTDSTNAPAAHKETSHYKVWRDAVAPMMATERTRRLYTSVFPSTVEGWTYPTDALLE
jgi:(4S)-4-hydroxy-5-phosphonooxypentane-2,3-dione isomerase